MKSDDSMVLPETLGNPCRASTPIPKKRCAPEPMVVHLENVSVDAVVKKKRKPECDTTQLASPSTRLSTSTLSTAGRMVSTSRLNITRGIQTMRPETKNRYCQVSVARIRKPTANQHVQTEKCLPPPAVSFNAIGCQTDEPLLPKTCEGTTQTDPLLPFSHPVQRDEVSCQTDRVEEQVQIEQSPAKQKKSKVYSMQQEIALLQECLANKTYTTIASKVTVKMGQILEQHMAQYKREAMASRARLIRWTKSFIRRQQHQCRAQKNAVPSRKIILVRKNVSAPKRPSLEEKGVQCVTELETRITVGTQWQRQKPMVTKKKPVSSSNSRSKSVPTTKHSSTDSKTCSAGSTVSMRQTKMSSYAKEQNAGESIQGRQQRQRKQQGECSSKPSKSDAVTAKPSSSGSKSSKAPATRPSPPPPSPQSKPKKKTRNETKAPKKAAPEICIDETPPSSSPPQRSEPELERKHFPYRSPPNYPTQCSKATETSFLTPSNTGNMIPEQMDNNRQPLNYSITANNNNRSFNPAVLVSPLERMYVEPSMAAAPTNRPQNNTFLVRSNESVPPTPPRSIMYLNPPERRLLLRSGPSNGGMVREKPPEISIISSQQLYSQIGLAVEKALQNRGLPSLAQMYGEPFFEVFNGYPRKPQGAANDGRRVDDPRSNEQTTKQQQQVTDRFVCSSGKEDANFQGSQQHFVRPPFHTERSPSLSPIVYDDENSDDEMIL